MPRGRAPSSHGDAGPLTFALAQPLLPVSGVGILQGNLGAGPMVGPYADTATALGDGLPLNLDMGNGATGGEMLFGSLFVDSLCLTASP